MTYPPQHPAPHSPAASAPARRGNRAGVVAVILVAAALAIQLGMTLVTASFIASTDRSSFEAYGLVSTLLAVLQGLVSLAAVIVGAIGLAARDRPKGFAGIGLGGGAVLLFGVLLGQLSNVLFVTLSS